MASLVYCGASVSSPRRQTIPNISVSAPGRYTLSLDYTGVIYQQASGFFALDYAGQNGQQRALFTQFENSDARRLIPSWDEPGVKAVYALTVEAPAGEMAVSNMPIAKSE